MATGAGQLIAGGTTYEVVFRETEDGDLVRADAAYRAKYGRYASIVELAFAPMTSAGLADVDAHDAGAASGLINTFHQLGSALGLGILATIGAAAVPAGASGAAALADRVSSALTGGTALLAVALLAVLVLIARRGTTRPPQLPTPDPDTGNDRTSHDPLGGGTMGGLADMVPVSARPGST